MTNVPFCVAEQGVPRYVTVEREAHTDFMVRRGLALIVNHGFAATPGGQKDFMYKVATIAGELVLARTIVDPYSTQPLLSAGSVPEAELVVARSVNKFR